MHPLDGLSPRRPFKNELGRTLQHHKMLHRGLPERFARTTPSSRLKERVVDEFYDPLTMLFRKIRGK
jgi:succinate dehydrogenase / fumarate reductase iron-sulfur subunit